MPKPDSIEELRQKVVRLRDQGLSFSEISQELRISKSYAVKLANTQPGAAPTVRKPATWRTSPSESGALPPNYLRGRASARRRLMRVCLRAAPIPTPNGPSRVRVSEVSSAPDWFQAGLSLDAIARVHAENLHATKVVAYATNEGQITDVLERPDYGARQRAVSDGYRAHGVFDARPAEPNYGCVIVRLNPEQRQIIENLCGPLDPRYCMEEEPTAVQGMAGETADAKTVDVTPVPQSDAGTAPKPDQSRSIRPLPGDAELISG